jgi:hypothetical protein
MTTRGLRWIYVLGSVALPVALLPPPAPTHAQGAPAIPTNATALEGVPRVRVDVTREGATRRQLDEAEAIRQRLRITIRDGRFYRGSDQRPLLVTTTGEFIYLSTQQPGKYVRVWKLDDRFTYVEHMDMPFGSVTFWGELRVVLER